MSLERKRAYDRARMARLHAEGKTWWQLHPDLRESYDSGGWKLTGGSQAPGWRAAFPHSWRKTPMMTAGEARRRTQGAIDEYSQAVEEMYAIPPPGGPHRDRRREVREREDEAEMMLDFGPAWGEEKRMQHMRAREW